MNPTTNEQVGEQNASYRKGLVLGLTMAEVGILIIFVLLLLIATEQLRRDQIFKEFNGKVPVEQSTLNSLKEVERTLEAIKRELGLKPETPDDDFLKLIRALASISKSKDGQAAMTELQRLLAEMKEAVKQVQTIAKNANLEDPEALAAVVQSKSEDNANLRGRLKIAETQLEKAGLGKGEWPCWVQPDGTIDYLYEVVLGSGGIRVREIAQPLRQTERSRLRMPAFDATETVSNQEFLDRTKALYERSLEDECRFFVVIYDGTQPHEKLIYKDRLRTVEGHFYKRLSNAAPPF